MAVILYGSGDIIALQGTVWYYGASKAEGGQGVREGICYVVGAGPDCILDFSPGPKDWVVAADGGLAHLAAAGLKADLVVGDFDTLGAPPDHPHVVKLRPEKDDTDMFAAVRLGLEQGYSTFWLYGGTGGRLDHTVANLQLLAFLARRGLAGYLTDRSCVMTAVENGYLTFGAGAAGFVSVFSLSDRSEGVTLEGLKYPLAGARLDNSFPLGVSNEFIGVPSRITVMQGTLLVSYPRGTPTPKRG